MKKITISLLTGLAALAGCTKSAVAPLSDTYPEPVTYTLTQLAETERTKDDAGKFHFPLTLSSAAGDRLTLVMVADTYYLPAKTFSGTTAEQAKGGNYIAEESLFSPAGGSESILNQEGTVTVTKDEDHYTKASDTTCATSSGWAIRSILPAAWNRPCR